MSHRNNGDSGCIAGRIQGLEEWEAESNEKIDLESSIGNQVEDEEAEKDKEES